MEFWFDDERPQISEVEALLFRAASAGHTETVIKLLAQGAKGDVIINGFNAVHMASKKNHDEIIQLIINNHSQHEELIYIRTEDGRTALMVAAYEGHVQVCRVLESIASSCALVDQQGNSALHYSVWGGHEEVTKFLVQECQVDSTFPNIEGLLPIQLASANNHVHLFPYLSGAEVQSAAGFNSLHRASMYGALETVQKLIEVQHLDANICTGSGNTCLHLAAKNGHTSVVKYLVECCELDVNARDDFQLTPLHFASIGGYKDIVLYLLANHADYSALNLNGASAFHVAASAGKHDICRILSEAGYTDYFAKDNEGHTAIDAALSSGYKDLASKIALWSTISIRTSKILESVDSRLVFTNYRAPKTLQAVLTSVEEQQLEVCGKFYDGVQRSAQEWLAMSDDDEDGLYGLELWDVVDRKNVALYTVWLYQVESGTIFKAGTTTTVAEFIQSYIQCSDPTLVGLLKDAHNRLKSTWSDSCCLKRMIFGSRAQVRGAPSHSSTDVSSQVIAQTSHT